MTDYEINFLRENCATMIVDPNVTIYKKPYCMSSATAVEPSFRNGFSSEIQGFKTSSLV